MGKKYIIDEDTLVDIGDSLRGALGETATYTPSEMKSKVATMGDEIAELKKYKNAFNAATNDGTDFSHIFADGIRMKASAITALDTSKSTDFEGMFAMSSMVNGEEYPTIDTSNGINFISMFTLSKVVNAPMLNTSKGTSFQNMFVNCWYLTSVPLYDLSSATNVSNMFTNCSSLTSIPKFDLSSAINFANFVSGCAKITELPALDTSKGTNFSNMCTHCAALKTIHGLDFSSLTKLASTTMPCNLSALENLTLNGILQVTMSFSNAPLTAESAKSVINALVNYTGTEYEFKKSIQFSSTTLTYLETEGKTAPGNITWTEYAMYIKCWNL